MSVQVSILAKVGRNNKTGELIMAITNFTVDKLTWLNLDAADPPVTDNTVPNGKLFEIRMREDNGDPSKDREWAYLP